MDWNKGVLHVCTPVHVEIPGCMLPLISGAPGAHGLHDPVLNKVILVNPYFTLGHLIKIYKKAKFANSVTLIHVIKIYVCLDPSGTHKVNVAKHISVFNAPCESF